jgi:hypothetical protein
MEDTELTSFIDGWLADHAWHLDARVLDFVLDVRLLASGTPAGDERLDEDELRPALSVA